MNDVGKMNISEMKEPERVLRNAVVGVSGIQQVPKGTRIIYHVGDYSDGIGQSKVGVMAKTLSDQKLVVLCQKKIGQETTEAGPIGRFEYMAVVM